MLTNRTGGQVKLNLTHRLSLASFLPILKFYPGLATNRPIQGLLVGSRYMEGNILVPFGTDMVNEGSSQSTVYERQWVARAAETVRKAHVETTVSSPYRGFCNRTGEKSLVLSGLDESGSERVLLSTGKDY